MVFPNGLAGLDAALRCDTLLAALRARLARGAGWGRPSGQVPDPLAEPANATAGRVNHERLSAERRRR